MGPSDRAVKDLVRSVVNSVHPLRIVLFGSAARGSMNADSDLDVLVVMPEDSPKRRTAQRLYQEIRGLGVPFEIVVATPQDLDKYENQVGLIYREILNEGIEIYAA
ncbi:MAG TPA: nucleotidyltransferase domain-containing protein [bacterium]|nr:nucleotidyltransferase domain-containing protein [bacterium]